MRRLALIALCTVATAGMAAAPAGAASVKIGRSIAGIRPGMSVAEVKQRLGRPASDGRVSGSRVLAWPRRGIAVSTYRQTSDVFTITTQSRRDRTAEGIGVGSSRGELRRAYPRARCTRYACTIGSFPRRRTSFAFSRDGRRVMQVLLLGARR
ncbi:MAG TPA: hypothetical protein VIL49_03745, partial [Capillimicrobium sp.]